MVKTNDMKTIDQIMTEHLSERDYGQEVTRGRIKDAIVDVAQAIGNELFNNCTEHIKSGGLRFYGIEFNQMIEILKKYGYEPPSPF